MQIFNWSISTPPLVQPSNKYTENTKYKSHKPQQKYTDNELIQLVNYEPHKLEFLIKNKIVSIKRAKTVIVPSIFDFEKNLLETLLDHDPKHIERLIQKKIFLISELIETKTFSNNYSFAESIFRKDPNMLDRFMNEKIITEHDLPDIKCTSGASILHYFARKEPEVLTRLIYNQNLNPRFIANIYHDTKTYHYYKIMSEGTVLGKLVKHHQKEFLKWILDYQWITIEDCNSKNAMIERRKDWLAYEYISVSEFFKRKNKVSLEYYIQQKTPKIDQKKLHLEQKYEEETAF